MSLLSINTTFNIQLNFELAPLHKRALALFIDYIIIFFYVYIAMSIFDVSFATLNDEDSDLYQTSLVLIIYLPAMFYSLICELLMKGQTIGKKILGIVVISEDGNDATRSQLFIRWAIKPFDTISSSYVVGLIAAAVTKNQQRLGDLAAGTAVVNTGLPYTINETILKNIDTDNYQVKYPEVMKLSDRDLNTINNIIQQYASNPNTEYVYEVKSKIENVLGVISDEQHPLTFLNKLLKDYNYLVGKK